MVDETRAAPDTPSDLGLMRVLQDDGSARPVSDPAAGRDVALAAYEQMRRLRLLDTRMVQLQRQGRVGFYGACTGQEATPIGTGLAITRQGKPTDWVFPALRESSIMLVRGLPLGTYLCQVFGNAGDLLKGRQMPSHMSARQVRQVSWSSNIGTQLPQAVGAAHAARLRGDDTVVVGFIGDGGTSETDFHTAMTFAAVSRAPCVLICQNNHFAISVPSRHQTAAETFAVKGRAYGIPSIRIDGNDVLAVYHSVSQAMDRARRGDGPTFIESVTYRIGAHSTSDDPTRYRSDDEVEAWRKRDPIDRLRAHLLRQGWWSDSDDETLDAKLNQEIGAAIAEAEAHPPPDRRTLFNDVYAELPWHLREQRDELLALPAAPKHGS